MSSFHTNTSPQTDRQTDRQTLEFNIPVFQKLYDFYKLLYQYLKSFPQKDRYVLGQKVENLTLETLQLIVLAGINGKDKKLPFIEKSIAFIDLIKIMLRLAKDISILDGRKYLQLESFLHEIGRMLGGWRKSLK